MSIMPCNQNRLKFSWEKEQKSFFTQTVSSYLRNECYCDARLACNGKSYPVHKFVLSLCSNLFKVLFETSVTDLPYLILTDTSTEDIESLLYFMYTGSVNVQQKNVTSVLDAALSMGIRGLHVQFDTPALLLDNDSTIMSKPVQSSSLPSSVKSSNISAPSYSPVLPPTSDSSVLPPHIESYKKRVFGMLNNPVSEAMSLKKRKRRLRLRCQNLKITMSSKTMFKDKNLRTYQKKGFRSQNELTSVRNIFRPIRTTDCLDDNSSLLACLTSHESPNASTADALDSSFLLEAPLARRNKDVLLNYSSDVESPKKSSQPDGIESGRVPFNFHKSSFNKCKPSQGHTENVGTSNISLPSTKHAETSPVTTFIDNLNVKGVTPMTTFGELIELKQVIEDEESDDIGVEVLPSDGEADDEDLTYVEEVFGEPADSDSESFEDGNLEGGSNLLNCVIATDETSISGHPENNSNFLALAADMDVGNDGHDSLITRSNFPDIGHNDGNVVEAKNNQKNDLSTKTKSPDIFESDSLNSSKSKQPDKPDIEPVAVAKEISEVDCNKISKLNDSKLKKHITYDEKEECSERIKEECNECEDIPTTDGNFIDTQNIIDEWDSEDTFRPNNPRGEMLPTDESMEISERDPLEENDVNSPVVSTIDSGADLNCNVEESQDYGKSSDLHSPESIDEDDMSLHGDSSNSDDDLPLIIDCPNYIEECEGSVEIIEIDSDHQNEALCDVSLNDNVSKNYSMKEKKGSLDRAKTDLDRAKKVKKKFIKNKELEDKCLTKPNVPVSDFRRVIYRCSRCKFLTVKRGKYLSHFKAHLKDSSSMLLSCAHCDYKTSSHNSFVSHRKKCYFSITYKCPECPFITEWKTTYTKHLKGHYGRTFSCPHCEFKTDVRQSMTLHLKQHSNKMHKCSLCSYSAYDDLNLTLHMRSHRNKELFTCSICSFVTPSKEELQVHREVHGSPENLIEPHKYSKGPWGRAIKITPPLQFLDSS